MEAVYSSVYYRIYMKLRTGIKVYLCENKWYGANYSKINCKWDTNRENALWFETSKDAEDFCKEYFKNFKDWEIECFEEIM